MRSSKQKGKRKNISIRFKNLLLSTLIEEYIDKIEGKPICFVHHNPSPTRSGGGEGMQTAVILMDTVQDYRIGPTLYS